MPSEIVACTLRALQCVEWEAVLSFGLGALAVSLGNTFAGRVSSLQGPKKRKRTEAGVLGEEILQALARLFGRLLVGSKCDVCDEPLRIRAVMPIFGPFSGCANKCRLPRRTLFRYTISELVGGAAAALAWPRLPQDDVSALAALVLVPFLLSFMLSLKEQLHDEVFRLGKQSKVGQAVKRIVNYYLTATFALVGVGFTVSLSPWMQVFGLVYLGWSGWLIGLWCIRANGGALEAAKEVSELPVRSFAVGLISGAAFGLIEGTIVLAGAGLLVWYQTRKPTSWVERYLEEWVLLVSFGLIVLIDIGVFP